MFKLTLAKDQNEFLQLYKTSLCKLASKKEIQKKNSIKLNKKKFSSTNWIQISC